MTQPQDHPTIQWWRTRSAMPPAMAVAIPLNAESLRELCLAAGADDVGFVEIDRPELADQRADILAAFPKTKTLISFVCRMNQENVRTPLDRSPIRNFMPVVKRSITLAVPLWND